MKFNNDDKYLELSNKFVHDFLKVRDHMGLYEFAINSFKKNFPKESQNYFATNTALEVRLGSDVNSETLVTEQNNFGELEWNSNGPINGSGIDFSNINFNCADLKEVDFRNANLASANLSKCKLNNALFGGANLLNANLANTIAENTDFTGANLSGSSLVGCKANNSKFINANFDNTDISATSLFKANLTGASLKNVKVSDLTDLLDCILPADVSEEILDLQRATDVPVEVRKQHKNNELWGNAKKWTLALGTFLAPVIAAFSQFNKIGDHFFKEMGEPGGGRFDVPVTLVCCMILTAVAVAFGYGLSSIFTSPKVANLQDVVPSPADRKSIYLNSVPAAAAKELSLKQAAKLPIAEKSDGYTILEAR